MRSTAPFLSLCSEYTGDIFSESEEKVLALYQLGVRLGEGAFGSVYEVTYTPSGERFALKVIRKDRLLYFATPGGEEMEYSTSDMDPIIAKLGRRTVSTAKKTNNVTENKRNISSSFQESDSFHPSKRKFTGSLHEQSEIAVNKKSDSAQDKKAKLLSGTCTSERVGGSTSNCSDVAYLCGAKHRKKETAMEKAWRLCIEQLESTIINEARVMQALEHPHVVKLYKFFKSDVAYYFLMDLAEQEFFDAIIAEGFLQEDIARNYFQQLISAIDYCHSKGIAHKDLKAENLLLSSDRRLLVCDFGFSSKYENSFISMENGPQDSSYCTCTKLGFQGAATLSYRTPEALLAGELYDKYFNNREITIASEIDSSTESFSSDGGIRRRGEAMKEDSKYSSELLKGLPTSQENLRCNRPHKIQKKTEDQGNLRRGRPDPAPSSSLSVKILNKLQGSETHFSGAPLREKRESRLAKLITSAGIIAQKGIKYNPLTELKGETVRAPPAKRYSRLEQQQYWLSKEKETKTSIPLASLRSTEQSSSVHPSHVMPPPASHATNLETSRRVFRGGKFALSLASSRSWPPKYYETRGKYQKLSRTSSDPGKPTFPPAYRDPGKDERQHGREAEKSNITVREDSLLTSQQPFLSSLPEVDPFLQDLWSAGVILFFMLTGRHPLKGSNDVETENNIRYGMVAFTQEEAERISQEARDLILSMLALEPDERFSLSEIIHHDWFTKDLNIRCLFPHRSYSFSLMGKGLSADPGVSPGSSFRAVQRSSTDRGLESSAGGRVPSPYNLHTANNPGSSRSSIRSPTSPHSLSGADNFAPRIFLHFSDRNPRDITGDEEAFIRSAFEAIHTDTEDRVDTISREEVRDALIALGEGTSKEEDVTEMMRLLTDSGDRQDATFEEFRIAWVQKNLESNSLSKRMHFQLKNIAQQLKHNNEELKPSFLHRLRLAFDQIDLHHTGMITAKELKCFFEHNHIQVEEESLLSLIDIFRGHSNVRPSSTLKPFSSTRTPIRIVRSHSLTAVERVRKINASGVHDGGRVSDNAVSSSAAHVGPDIVDKKPDEVPVNVDLKGNPIHLEGVPSDPMVPRNSMRSEMPAVLAISSGIVPSSSLRMLSTSLTTTSSKNIARIAKDNRGGSNPQISSTACDSHCSPFSLLPHTSSASFSVPTPVGLTEMHTSPSRVPPFISFNAFFLRIKDAFLRHPLGRKLVFASNLTPLFEELNLQDCLGHGLAVCGSISGIKQKLLNATPKRLEMVSERRTESSSSLLLRLVYTQDLHEGMGHANEVPQPSSSSFSTDPTVCTGVLDRFEETHEVGENMWSKSSGSLLLKSSSTSLPTSMSMKVSSSRAGSSPASSFCLSNDVVATEQEEKKKRRASVRCIAQGSPKRLRRAATLPVRVKTPASASIPCSQEKKLSLGSPTRNVKTPAVLAGEVEDGRGGRGHAKGVRGTVNTKGMQGCVERKNSLIAFKFLHDKGGIPGMPARKFSPSPLSHLRRKKGGSSQILFSGRKGNENISVKATKDVDAASTFPRSPIRVKGRGPPNSRSNCQEAPFLAGKEKGGGRFNPSLSLHFAPLPHSQPDSSTKRRTVHEERVANCDVLHSSPIGKSSSPITEQKKKFLQSSSPGSASLVPRLKNTDKHERNEAVDTPFILGEDSYFTSCVLDVTFTEVGWGYVSIGFERFSGCIKRYHEAVIFISQVLEDERAIAMGDTLSCGESELI